MQIRSAPLSDLDVIEPLWWEMMDFHIAYEDSFSLSPDADAKHREYMAGLLEDQARRILVADNDSRLLGYRDG